jgi:hypothetical protein
MSIVVDARIREMALQRGVSCSRLVEDLIGSIDYGQIFALFEEGMAFPQIVIQTNLPPMLVRELYADYKAGLHVNPMEEPATVREHERYKRAEVIRDSEAQKTERARINAAVREHTKELEATVRLREADVKSLQAQLEALTKPSRKSASA